jgi:hypothetical protein
MGDITNRVAAAREASKQSWSKQMAERMMNDKPRSTEQAKQENTARPAAPTAVHGAAAAQAPDGSVRRQLVAELDRVRSPPSSRDGLGPEETAKWLSAVFPMEGPAAESRTSSTDSRVPSSPRTADSGQKIEVSSSLRTAPGNALPPLPPSQRHRQQQFQQQQQQHAVAAAAEAEHEDGAGGEQTETWWECDFCSRAFAALSEASEHEARCLENPHAAARPGFLPGSDIRAMSPNRTLSPIVEAPTPASAGSSARAPSPAREPAVPERARDSPGGVRPRPPRAERPPLGAPPRGAQSAQLPAAVSLNGQTGQTGPMPAPALAVDRAEREGAREREPRRARAASPSARAAAAGGVELNGQTGQTGPMSARAAAAGGVELSIPPVQLFTQSQAPTPPRPLCTAPPRSAPPHPAPHRPRSLERNGPQATAPAPRAPAGADPPPSPGARADRS